MLNPKAIEVDLNRLARRYKNQQKIFVEFANHVIECFTETKHVDELILTSYLDQNYFEAQFIDHILQFRFEFDDKSNSSIVIYDAANPKEPKRKMQCDFDGQGKVSFKDDEDDDIYIASGSGISLFLHLLHEGIKLALVKIS
jgi:hypothetical protein